MQRPIWKSKACAFDVWTRGGTDDTISRMDYKISYRTSVPHLAASTCLDMGNVQYANGGRNGNETLKGCVLGITYSRPGDYFLRLDWARRIGLPDDASDAAKARNRLWFTIGKVW